MVQARKGMVQGLVPAWHSTGAEKSEVVGKCFRTTLVRLVHWCRLSIIAGKCSETALVRMVHLAQPKIRPEMRHPPAPGAPALAMVQKIKFFKKFLIFLIFRLDKLNGRS